jgi:hypothetical protein
VCSRPTSDERFSQIPTSANRPAFVATIGPAEPVSVDRRRTEMLLSGKTGGPQAAGADPLAIPAA